MKLLVFLAKGFETIEFSAFIDVMGWAKTDFDCKIDVAGITRDLSMEKFDYSDIARTNVKYDGARLWDCQYLQAILVVGYVFLFA